MSLWHVTAAAKMTDFMKSYFPAAEVSFTGSFLNPETLDIYSDVDMKVSPVGGGRVNLKAFVGAMSVRVYGVFGYETHINADSDVLRVCFDNGWRFDITLEYGTPQARESGGALADNIDSVINQFWFLSSMVLVKLGRGDYLIAAHLALELCRLVIVIQMLVRDGETKTDIHRFGGFEEVPALKALATWGERRDNSQNTGEDILNILFLAAECMDMTAAANRPDYTARTGKLRLMRLHFSNMDCHAVFNGSQ